MAKIIADKREKNSLVIAGLIDKKIEVEFKHLPVADYLIGNLAIERKTGRDFLSSMMNKRILRQLEEIKQYPKQLLIIEDYENLLDEMPGSKMHPNAIKGMLLSVLLKFSIPIIFTKDAEETAEYLAVILKRLEKEEKGIVKLSLRAIKKTYSIQEQQQMILEGFQGIGPTLAKAILKKFKTIKRFVNANKKDLEKIKRLNSKKIEAIRKLLNHRFKHKKDKN